jgi:hypothetical protein
MPVTGRVYDLWRRLAGRYTIDDPRPVSQEAPYTYFLPSENELLALAPGDLVKLIFRSHPPGREWDAERMWVTVTRAEAEALHGRLDNDPFDMPQLRSGAAIGFKRSEVIDIIWSTGRATPPPPAPERRTYWERCMVDSCVHRGDCQVDYLYREAPDLAGPEDEYPDSGWRIRGTDEGVAEDSREGRAPLYVALGAVLNADDSWLHLVDEPVGSAFIRDRETGRFVPCSRSGEI